MPWPLLTQVVVTYAGLLAIAADPLAPWFNISLPLNERAEALVAAMRPHELIQMLAKASPPVSRLGVPGYA